MYSPNDPSCVISILPPPSTRKLECFIEIIIAYCKIKFCENIYLYLYIYASTSLYRDIFIQVPLNIQYSYELISMIYKKFYRCINFYKCISITYKHINMSR